jgi:F0F1-type ATP synthase membrane subunit b/b'
MGTIAWILLLFIAFVYLLSKCFYGKTIEKTLKEPLLGDD